MNNFRNVSIERSMNSQQIKSKQPVDKPKGDFEKILNDTVKSNDTNKKPEVGSDNGASNKKPEKEKEDTPLPTDVKPQESIAAPLQSQTGNLIQLLLEASSKQAQTAVGSTPITSDIDGMPVTNLAVNASVKTEEGNPNVASNRISLQEQAVAQKGQVKDSQGNQNNLHANSNGEVKTETKEIKMSSSAATSQIAEVKEKPLSAQNVKATDTSADSIVKDDGLQITQKNETFDLSKINIKVGNSAKAEKMPVDQQVAEKIVFHAKNGKQEFDIALQPKELGKINIKLVVENGSAQVLVNCANSKTQNLLSLNAESIRSIVEMNTGLHTTINVQDENKQQPFHQQQREPEEREEGQNRQPQKDDERNQFDEEYAISFVNQLRLGLVEQTVFT